MNFITLIICIFPPHDGEKIFKCILSCIYSLIMLMYAKYNNIYFWISLHVKWIYEYYKHLYTTHNCFICFHIFLNIIGWKHFEKWNWFLWPNAELSIDFTFNTLNSLPLFFGANWQSMTIFAADFQNINKFCLWSTCFFHGQLMIFFFFHVTQNI